MSFLLHFNILDAFIGSNNGKQTLFHILHIEKEAEDASHYWPAPYPSVLLNMDQFVYELNAGVEQDFPL